MSRRLTGNTASTGLLAVLTVLSVVISGCSSSKSGSQAGAGNSTSTNSGASVSFDDVTVDGANDLASKPKVSSKSSSTPTGLEVKDLVTGDGAAANPTANVTVQYVGVLYPNGKQFDASWDHGGATSFPLTGVVPGFTQGIGGNGQVAPMKVGGRRIMILPAALGYGAGGTPDGSIPPNTPLVFVVDLVGVG